MDVEKKLDMSLDDLIKQSVKAPKKTKSLSKPKGTGTSGRNSSNTSKPPSIAKGAVSKRGGRTRTPTGEVSPSTALALKRLQAPRLLPSNNPRVAMSGKRLMKLPVPTLPSGNVTKKEAQRTIEAAQAVIKKAKDVLEMHNGTNGARKVPTDYSKMTFRKRMVLPRLPVPTKSPATSSRGARGHSSQARRAPAPEPVRLPSGAILPSRMQCDHIHSVKGGVKKTAPKSTKSLTDRFGNMSVQPSSHGSRRNNRHVVMP